jgi:hypothetical protein
MENVFVCCGIAASKHASCSKEVFELKLHTLRSTVLVVELDELFLQSARRKFSVSNFKLGASGFVEKKKLQSSGVKCSQWKLRFSAQERRTFTFRIKFNHRSRCRTVSARRLNQPLITKDRHEAAMLSPLSVSKLLSRFILLHVFSAEL